VLLLLLLLINLTDLFGTVFTNCGAGPAAAPVCKQTATLQQQQQQQQHMCTCTYVKLKDTQHPVIVSESSTFC
jgi:hypothetical protein